MMGGLKEERSRGWERLGIKMGLIFMGILRMIILMVWDFISGRMGKFILGNGVRMKDMDMELQLGKMDLHIQYNNFIYIK